MLTNQPAFTDPVQQQFRETLHEVEGLRARLQALRSSQATARQTYWRQVGPLAAATVAARRALYTPLEAALLAAYLTRAEVQQVTELLLAIARDLEARFGEDEAEMLARYAPPLPPPEDEEPIPTAPAAAPEPAPHERHAAEARARRQRRAKAAIQEPAPDALPASAKAAYRELARRHHPDRAALAGAAAQQAQTTLMQRVTAAYAAGDLATLLSMLAEGSATPASEVSEELLTRYTQALRQQRAKLAQELTQSQAGTDEQPWSGTEKQQRTRLRDTKRGLRLETDYLHALLRQLTEPATLRQTLRELGKAGF